MWGSRTLYACEYSCHILPAKSGVFLISNRIVNYVYFVLKQNKPKNQDQVKEFFSLKNEKPI
jgi:hypothetical protein